MKISLNLPVDASCVSLPLQPLAVPNPPALRVVLPRFSNTYLVWRDPQPFVGDILGVQIRYLIDCIPQSIPEQGSGIKHYSVSGIKSSAGKTHSISVRARTSAGCGSFSAPVLFTFQPIGKASDVHINSENAFSLKSARDLRASVKHESKWCQMCALTHRLSVEMRCISPLQSGTGVYVYVLHAVCYIMQAS